VAVVAVYCCCSSMMLIVNKLAVHHVGAPAFVTWLQVRLGPYRRSPHSASRWGCDGAHR
jgi:hypothetical protein